MPSIPWRPTEILAATALDSYRGTFKAAVAAGQVRPITILIDFVPGFFVPILYLCIPHTKRPWVYQARWLVLAFIVGYSIHMMRTVSSANIAMTYATGLWASWSVIHNFAMLVWMKPQFEAERVQRRRKKSKAEGGSSDPGSRGSKSQISTNLNHTNGSASNSTNRKSSARFEERSRSAAGTFLANADDKFEYYWQAYPENGSFLERLNWAFDLYANFRGAGWNWAVAVIPSPERPEKPLSGEPVKMDTIPMRTSSGYRTYNTEHDFYRTKLLACAWAYLAVDILKVYMMKDPYFIYGPNSEPLPDHLANISPPWLLPVVRSIMLLVALHAAIVGIVSLHDVMQYTLMSRVYPIRGELWRYSSVFGSFSKVLDRGMPGFWGAWWHQTFRIAFAGPGMWLVRNGHLESGTLKAKTVTMLFAFLQSGFIHGAGSVTGIPETKPWYPLLFFMLSGLGVVVQQTLCTLLKSQIAVLPRWIRRAGNLVFVTLWLHFTIWPLADDFAVVGIWLLEPVPFSLIRGLGFGQIDHSIWRLDRDTFPGWVSGQHWWQSGIGG